MDETANRLGIAILFLEMPLSERINILAPDFIAFSEDFKIYIKALSKEIFFE